MSNFFKGYDAWKTASPYDDEDGDQCERCKGTFPSNRVFLFNRQWLCEDCCEEIETAQK